MDPFIIQPMFQLLTLLVTALSSFFLIRSVIKLSSTDLAKISGTYWNYNPNLGENFATQKANTVVGFMLLMLSVLLQAYTVAQPLRWADTAGLNLAQILIVLFVFVVIFGVAELTRRFLIKKYVNELNREFSAKKEM